MSSVRRFVCVVLCLSMSRAWGATIAVSAGDRGWYNSDGAHEPGNTNYVTGQCTDVTCETSFREYRNFFEFDLTDIAGRIAGATLRLFVPAEGFGSPTGMETYGVFHVDTSVDELGSRWGTDIFEDLGSGAAYGEYAASVSDELMFIEIELNAAALVDLNAATALFAIGGAITTLDAEINDELLFLNSGDGILSDTQLVLETVPLPGAVWLLLSAGLALLHQGRER